jgi:hypothetical protein
LSKNIGVNVELSGQQVHEYYGMWDMYPNIKLKKAVNYHRLLQDLRITHLVEEKSKLI